MVLHTKTYKKGEGKARAMALALAMLRFRARFFQHEILQIISSLKILFDLLPCKYIY